MQVILKKEEKIEWYETTKMAKPLQDSAILMAAQMQSLHPGFLILKANKKDDH